MDVVVILGAKLNNILVEMHLSKVDLEKKECVLIGGCWTYGLRKNIIIS